MKKRMSIVLIAVVILTLSGISAPAQSGADEPSRILARDVVDTFTYGYGNNFARVYLRSYNFSEEFRMMKEMVKIGLTGLNHPEFVQALGMFPDSYWATTGLSTDEIMQTLLFNRWNFSVAETPREMRIYSDFKYQVIVTETNPGKNIFYQYSGLDAAVPNLGNTILHEMVHLVEDGSRRYNGDYRGFIHHQNYFCDLDVQRSVPYTVGNTFDMFLRNQLKRMEREYGKPDNYDEVINFLQYGTEPYSYEDNRFLTKFIFKNTTDTPIHEISVTYKYTGCSEDIRYTFTTGSNFFHDFYGIGPYETGELFIVPIFYWGLYSITINGTPYYLEAMFPFGGDIPYCSTVAGKAVRFEYRNEHGITYLQLIDYKTER